MVDGRETINWFHLDFVPVASASGEFQGALAMASNVTDHVECIHDLSETEERLRLALDGSGMVGVWAYEISTGLSTADANVARTFGLSTLACKTGVDDGFFIKAIHPDDRLRVRAAFARAIETRSPYQCKYRIAGGDGRMRWVITSAKPSLGSNGEVICMLGVVVDVTDQMETATALAESQIQFELLTETLPQIVWSCGPDGRHDYFSKRWSEFTGIEREDIAEDTWKELVFPDHWPTVSAAWDAACRSGEPYDIDYRFRHHSGEYRWLRVMALPMRDDDGAVTRWFGTSTDVHDAYLMTEQQERLALELEKIAMIDQLTEVLTRRAFIDKASTLISGNIDAGKVFSLLMIDIDHFKAINDTHGHAGGDSVLRFACKRMHSCLKQQDLIGRLGGEEFAVLLPDCSLDQARQVAERILRMMETEPIKLDSARHVLITVSIGITTNSPDASTLEQLLAVADQALYDAKNSGRNRAVISSAHAA